MPETPCTISSGTVNTKLLRNKKYMNRKTILTFLFAAAALGASAQRITAKQTVIDCGSVLYEQPVTAKFELRNKGNDLIIDTVRTSCGCVAAKYPEGVISKGDNFVVEVTFDSRQLGHFNKEAAIYSNASDKPLYLTMRGVVVDHLTDYSGVYDFMLGSVRADKNNIEFDDVNLGEMPSQKIHIVNSSSENVSPVVMHLPDYLTATVTPATITPGHAGIATITLNSNKLRSYGLTQSSVYLGMYPGDKIDDSKEISVSAVLLPEFRNMSETQLANAPVIKLSTETLDLGSFGDKSNLSGTIIIENQGRSRLNISSMQMFTTGMKVRLNKSRLNPGESAKMKITVYKKQLKNARSKPRVLMITNDPNKSKVVIHVKVK